MFSCKYTLPTTGDMLFAPLIDVESKEQLITNLLGVTTTDTFESFGVKAFMFRPDADCLKVIKDMEEVCKSYEPLLKYKSCILDGDVIRLKVNNKVVVETDKLTRNCSLMVALAPSVYFKEHYGLCFTLKEITFL